MISPDDSTIKFNKGTNFRSSGVKRKSTPKGDFEEVMRKREIEDKTKTHQLSENRARGFQNEENSSAIANATKKPKTSIFDMAPQRKIGRESSYVERDPGKEQALVRKEKSVPALHDDEPLYPQVTATALDEKITTKFTPDQPDLSSVNLIAGAPVNFESASMISPKVAPVSVPSPIHEIVNQLIDKLYIVTTQTQTDTTLTLKHPPGFEGVKITISEFKTAKGEFNIAFENLTSVAKNQLDVNLYALRNGIEQKGYVIHMMTTTTIEGVSNTAEAERSMYEEREQRRQQQQQNREEEA